MGAADWTDLGDGLDSSVLTKGVTAGITPPNGGGTFVYGFNSRTAAAGAAGIFVDLADFNPLASGGSIFGALKRGAGAGTTGWSSFMFLGLQGTSVNDWGYLLGLVDSDPYKIVLAKAQLSVGLVTSSSYILMESDEQFLVSDDQWHHLRLNAVANDNGDVVLNVYQSDLGAHAVTAPSWVAIPGMSQFIDDQLAINSGLDPYTSGYAGIGMRTGAITRRSYFDHIAVLRQT